MANRWFVEKILLKLLKEAVAIGQSNRFALVFSLEVDVDVDVDVAAITSDGDSFFHSGFQRSSVTTTRQPTPTGGGG